MTTTGDHGDERSGADGQSLWISFPGLRVDALRAAQRWDDALLRELQLMVRGDPAGVRADLAELRTDLDRVSAAITHLRPALEDAMRAAVDAGRPLDDVVLVVTPEVVHLAEEADAAFLRIDAHCGGVMLLSPAPPEANGFRRWFLGQFHAQAAGQAPVSWDEWWVQQGESDGVVRSPT
jgi:hypothetical protein